MAATLPVHKPPCAGKSVWIPLEFSHIDNYCAQTNGRKNINFLLLLQNTDRFTLIVFIFLHPFR